MAKIAAAFASERIQSDNAPHYHGEGFDSIKLIATAWRPIDVKLIIRNARQEITVNGQRSLVSANATIFSYLGFDGKLKVLKSMQPILPLVPKPVKQRLP
ncbi:MAG: hypothetical protein IPP67_04120 [Rhodospirillaceae bacterium]|nr:hypothetical protein [Rhodospirillaceae bacterium]